MSRNRNWIEGEWRAARAGREFDAGRFGSWPRSAAADVTDALAGFEPAVAEWRALSADERADRLGELLDLWEDEGELEEDFAEVLGLEARALEDARFEALELGDELIETPPPLGPEAPTLARAAAGSLGAGLVRCTLPALLEGRAVLLLSDREAPQLAADFCELLDQVGLPRGLVALLHDDASTCARAALASERFGRVALVETPERAVGLAKVLEAAPRPPREVGARFGSGVLPRAAPQFLHTPCRQTTHVVLRGDDPEAAAREVCEAAFGAGRALSGQRDGCPGRVLCHELHLSRFTEALLAAVDALGPPCALFDRSLPRHVETLSRLGLDEGATLIRGPFGDSTGSRRGRRDAILAPSVFTNVEPRMALARAERPAPVLRLLRLGADEEAAELEAALTAAAPSS